MPSIARIQKILEKASQQRQAVVAYSGQNTVALRGGVAEDQAWQIQGYQASYETSLWIKAGDLNGLESRTRIVVNGETRRILGIHPDSMGAIIRIDIGNEYAGA